MSADAELLDPGWVTTEEGKPIKPTPGFAHSSVQANLTGEFLKHRAFRACSELDIQLNGRPLRPDLCLYPREPLNLKREIYRRTDPPPLAVEIVSAGQGLDEVMEKTEFYLSAGVQSVWVVVPPVRTVTICTPDGQEQTFSSRGTITDPATGVTADLAAVFS